MRVILQRSKNAKVSIAGEVVGQIDHGLVLLVGFTATDSRDEIEYLVKKIVNCRIFSDEDGKLNLNVKQVQGEILSVSQFTLYADTKKGNRPSFSKAQAPEQAQANYELFNEMLAQAGVSVKTGSFGADMQVELVNDGPVTIIFDTDNK